MFTVKPKRKSKLQMEIDQTLTELQNYKPDTKEYAQITDQIVKLHKMKADEKPYTVSPDTLALIAANLIGIVMILKHERADIITSKAMSFVTKPR